MGRKSKRALLSIGENIAVYTERLSDVGRFQKRWVSEKTIAFAIRSVDPNLQELFGRLIVRCRSRDSEIAPTDRTVFMSPNVFTQLIAIFPFLRFVLLVVL